MGPVVRVHGRHRWGESLTRRLQNVKYTVSDIRAQVTWSIGQDTAVRGQFVNNRALDNTKDTNFRAINVDW